MAIYHQLVLVAITVINPYHRIFCNSQPAKYFIYPPFDESFILTFYFIFRSGHTGFYVKIMKMQQQGTLKFLFVVNPISGGTRKQGLITLVSDYFAALPHSVEFYLLNSKNDSVSLAHWIKDIQPDRVVAVGGDG